LIDIKRILAPPGKKISLKDYDPGYCDDYKDKDAAEEKLEDDIKKMKKLQYRLYAENKHSLLIILQAPDAAGKDGAIRHVMSGINPQGTQVFSFKQPSREELDHDFLWRCVKALPERGRIGIFNRSHYEEVLVVKVHPEYLLNQNLPGINSVEDVTPEFWQSRYEQINNFEKHLTENGTTVVKFFLHLSKEEQKKRFLSRIDDEDKNWKFSDADMTERGYWDEYVKANEDMLSNTSTEWAPWYIIPADKKWFSRTAIGDIVTRTLEKINPQIPEVSEEARLKLQEIKRKLESGEV
jgi:PPK2 family polyphosphate:nucleotide phosphotransferase